MIIFRQCSHHKHLQAPEESRAKLLALTAEGSPFGARILATAERNLPDVSHTVTVIKVRAHESGPRHGLLHQDHVHQGRPGAPQTAA